MLYMYLFGILKKDDPIKSVFWLLMFEVKGCLTSCQGMLLFKDC